MEPLSLFFELVHLPLDIHSHLMAHEQLEMSRSDGLIRQKQYELSKKEEKRRIEQLGLYKKRIGMAEEELSRDLVKENEFLFEKNEKEATARMLRGFSLKYSFGHIVLRSHMTAYKKSKVTLPVNYFVASNASDVQKQLIVYAYIDSKLETTKPAYWFNAIYYLVAASLSNEYLAQVVQKEINEGNNLDSELFNAIDHCIKNTPIIQNHNIFE